MKYYLYHRVPSDLRGEVLYPLNVLKSLHPDLYKEKVKKYIGREEILGDRIPPLNCFWNDVLHLSAVHPQEIKKAFTELGEKFPSCRFYQVDPHLLEPENTTVFLYKNNLRSEKALPTNYASYDPKDLKQYSKLPITTKKYYKEIFEQEKSPLLWHKVPHILYKGTLDTSLLKIIEI